MEANQMDWGVVMATVQENQEGFEGYAAKRDATYAYHMGNTNQQVDMHLFPFILNASEWQMPDWEYGTGRGLDPRIVELDPDKVWCVHIGEEFDSERMFGYEPPDGAKFISSFVNCMPSIRCYPLVQQAMTLLPDWTFHIHGIDGPDEVMKPISLVAAEMAKSSFGWHDKEHGDGYGHVLHYWASIGRPLIGHASHYAGKNGSVYWVDGVTCIDLDRHSVADCARLVQEIVNDPPRHQAMCEAIRAVFDANTDWAGDAEKVKGLLG
jgi:hypothetical protein